MRDAGGELGVLKPSGDLATGVGGHLAVFACDDVGQLVGPRVQQLTEGEQDG